ncbi:glycosyltransferase [Pelagibacterales bacterium SAG-MED35]|nr:glycosyltransferase [Pelagibacterales bacterium SAG-MED35]
MNDLTIIIPDYKSKYLDKVIEKILILEPNKIIISNYKTQFTSEIENKYQNYKNIKFLNHITKNYPGENRNLGADNAYTDNLLFLDSDVLVNNKTIEFIKQKIKEGLSENIIYWGVYSKDGDSTFAKIQNLILRYRFSNKFYEDSKSKNKPYFSQSSHFLIKRKTYKEIGGFSPYLRIKEDTEFNVRAEIFGIENKVYEDFEVDHLNQYNLINDYFIKPSYAATLKIIEPLIFGKTTIQTGTALLFSWIFLPVAFSILLPIFFLLNINLIFLLSLFIINYLLIPKDIKDDLSLYQKVYSIFLFPIIGLYFLFGGFFGVIRGIQFYAKNFVTYVYGYLAIFYKIIVRTGSPIQIINFITSRCNMRCPHCFYKNTLDKKDPGEMDLEIIDKYTKNFGTVLWYGLGGGEPFLRKDIHKLYSIVLKNCNPKFFTIPTNGWYTDRLFNSVLRMLQFTRGKSPLVIQFSIDGYEKGHDEIRGEKSYERMITSLNKLKPLTKIYKNLQLSIITVVTDQNRSIYPEFIDHLATLGTNQISINIVRHENLDHPPLPVETVEKYKLAVERYEEYLKNDKMKSFTFFGSKLMRLKEALQKDLIYDVARNNKFVTPCTAGDLSYVIWEDGRVNACEVLHDTIGNITDENTDKSFFQSKKAKDLRKKIKDTKCKCTYECAMTTNTLFSWNMTKKLAKAYFLNRV